VSKASNLHAKTSQSCTALAAVWNNSVTEHRLMCSILTPARQDSSRHTYPGGLKG